MRDYHCHKSYNNLSINIYKRRNVRDVGCKGMMNRDCQSEKGGGGGAVKVGSFVRRDPKLAAGAWAMRSGRGTELADASLSNAKPFKILSFLAMRMHMHSMHA